MDDLISRQAAIDALDKLHKEDIEDYGCEIPEGFNQDNLDRAIFAIKQLPTIQPVATDTNVGDTISRKAMIDALHTWFRDGFDEDKWWNSTHVLAVIEGLPSVQQEHKWETCFECPLSHGCPKIKGCTNEQAIEYASQIPNDCPLSAQPNLQPTCNQLATDTNVGNNSEIPNSSDCISRQQAIDAMVDAIWHYPNECYRNLNIYEIAEGFVKEALKTLPTIQPERAEGEWIVHLYKVGVSRYECDACHARCDIIYPYCPYCGEKKEGERDAIN